MSLLLIFFLHFSIKTRNQKKRNQPWMFGLQQGGRGLAPERMLGLTSSRGACWEKLERHTCAYLCMRDAAVAAFEGWAGWKRKTWWTEWKEEPKSPAEIKYSKSSQRVRGGGARRYDVLQKQRRDFPITAELNTNEANQNSFWGKRPSRQLQNPELTDWRRRCWLTFSHANERDGEHERCGDTRTGLSWHPEGRGGK